MGELPVALRADLDSSVSTIGRRSPTTTPPYGLCGRGTGVDHIHELLPAGDIVHAITAPPRDA